MSDKMLMEDWRKYLAETPQQDIGDAQAAADIKRNQILARSRRETEAAKEEEERKKNCMKISEYLHFLAAIMEEKSAAMRARKQEELQGQLTRGVGSLAVGSAITIATGGGGLVLGLAAGATHGLGELAYDIAQKWRSNQPSESILDNNPFLDALDWHPKFTDRLSDEVLDEVMNAWGAKIKAELSDAGDRCVDEIDDIAITDINAFTQEYLELCKDEAAYEGRPDAPGAPTSAALQGAADAGEAAAMGMGYGHFEESKFHDDWRNFLFTEEKL